MKRVWIINSLVALFALSFFMKGVRPEKETEFHLNAFAEVPVKFEGRKKPIDTMARNLLTILSGKQTLRKEGEKISANRWLLGHMAGHPDALNDRVIRIENLDVLSSIGLEERKGFRYSFAEILPNLGRINATARVAYAKESSARDLYDRQIMKLANQVFTFENAINSFAGPMAQASGSVPLVISPDAATPRWRSLAEGLFEGDPRAAHFAKMLVAYRDDNAELFNAELATFSESILTDPKIAFEVFYNRLGAFMKSAEIYLLVFVLSCFGWLFRKEGLLSAARTLMVCAFIPHTFAIVARMFLSGYPPVTNLYSSAIFIGWGAVATGIVLELGLRKKAGGMGNLVGGIAGFSTLLVAHFLAGDGDTMEQMRAVLDTRFWLTTHVITISLGYMATFVAGTIGVFYILSGLFTRRLDPETEEGMYRMMYGTVCFALLFSFVGTVLGGLWADDSWGRFWGWDPKENGALLIVMWNAIMLHARYGKMVKHRGFAVMAVFGNIVTAWSWFGVNQLGVGLHSYGFTDSASFWLIIFALTQATLCIAGLAPSNLWKSGAVK